MSRGVSVAVSLGPAGIKPTEAKKPTVGLVPAEAKLSSYQAFPPELLFFFRLSGGRKRGESGVSRGVSVAVSHAPAGIKPTEAK